MKHKLIIVEGLPCSGKSTTSRFIAERLGMRYFDEDSQDHPADYGFHAFLQNSELSDFSDEERKTLLANSADISNGIITPLYDCNEELFEKLLPHKIYDFLHWDIEKPLMLDKWRSFAKTAEAENSGYVLNCVFLQNPMCETMMRFGFDESVSAQHISEINEIIKPLSPFVVYLKSSDIRTRINAAVAERGQEWLYFVVDYHCNGAYGKQHDLKGFDGYISALEERQRRELDILSRLDTEHMMIEVPVSDWDSTYEEIIRQLTGDTNGDII